MSLISRIDGRPIFYRDSANVTHLCEGSEVHPGVRLFWTLCLKDVPADQGFLPGDDDALDCPKCISLGAS